MILFTYYIIVLCLVQRVEICDGTTGASCVGGDAGVSAPPSPLIPKPLAFRHFHNPIGWKRTVTWYSAKDLQFNLQAQPADGGGFCEVLVGTLAGHGKVALKRIGVSA